jgi:hypothetical protein
MRCCPPPPRELRERGHDVLAVAGHPDWAALSDPEGMALARTERRAIAANNLRDHRPLHADAITPGGPGYFGMVFMPGSYRRTKADTGRIISALEAKLAEYPGDKDLANGECWLYQRPCREIWRLAVWRTISPRRPPRTTRRRSAARSEPSEAEGDGVQRV